MDRTSQSPGRLSRRRFVQTASGLGLAAAGLALGSACGTLGKPVGPSFGAAGPETTRIRIPQGASLCQAPLFLARDALRAKGFTARLDYAAQTLKDLPYNRWREYDPEDTLRFYALKLHEIGMIKITPDRVIAQATDWRFFNELKRELKA